MLTVGLGAVGGFLYYFVVKALNADIDIKYRKTKIIQYLLSLIHISRYVQQGGKLFVARSRQVLRIAVNGLQCLLFRHDPLQGLVGRNARQYLPLEVVLLFLARCV